MRAAERRPAGDHATIDRQILSLPIYPELTDAEVDRVIASLRRYAGSR